jgi:hypothetical protein
MTKTSLFFKPSNKLAHLYKNSTEEQRLERIRIAAGLRTRDQLPKLRNYPQSEFFQLQKPHLKGFRLPNLGTDAYGNKYGSAHYSVYDPLARFQKVFYQLFYDLRGTPLIYLNKNLRMQDMQTIVYCISLYHFLVRMRSHNVKITR